MDRIQEAGRFNNRWFKPLVLAVSSILLAIFLVAKIPSSKCHCNDPVKSKKELCPFGALRALTAVQTTTTPKLALPSYAIRAVDNFEVCISIESAETPSHRSRGPPAKV